MRSRSDAFGALFFCSSAIGCVEKLLPGRSGAYVGIIIDIFDRITKRCVQSCDGEYAVKRQAKPSKRCVREYNAVTV